MRVSKYILILLLACSVVEDVDPAPPGYVAPYLEAFKTEASIRGQKIDISKLIYELTELKDGREAWGEYVFPNRIRLDSGFWFFYYPTECDYCPALEILVFHEIGHYLGKPHTDTVGIMFPHIMNVYTSYNQNRTKYLNDFFNADILPNQ